MEQQQEVTADEDLWAVDFADLELQGNEIGTGQFGKVYRAVLFGGSVAAKQILKEKDVDAKYLNREITVLRGLAHPNITQFIGLSKDGSGNVWLISEFVANGNLCNLLYRKEDPLRWSRRIQWALDCIQAVAFIHSKNLIHRDIKSENLLLDEHDKVKICDFGFARRIDQKLETLQNKKKMAALTIAGTDEWMAPEVIVGTPYGKPADMFSYGITLTEMILREKPSERHPRNAFDFEANEFESKVPADCPPEFSALVVHCCQYDPAKRPEARVVVKGLKDLVAAVVAKEAGGGGAGAGAGVSESVAATPADGAARCVEAPPPEEEVESLRGSASNNNNSNNNNSTSVSSTESASLYSSLLGTIDRFFPSNLPDEDAPFRALAIPLFESASAADASLPRKWVFFQDVAALHPVVEGWLKIQFGELKKKVLKAYCALVGNVILYWKSNRKGEKNMGRILLDKSLQLDLQEVKKKKFALQAKLWGGRELTFSGATQEELQRWRDALLGASVSVDFDAVFDRNHAAGRTALTRTGSVFLGNVGDISFLIAVSESGIRFLNPFVEEIELEIPWKCVLRWQIGMHEHVELVFVNGKKNFPVQFKSSGSAADLYNCLEKMGGKKETDEPGGGALSPKGKKR